MLTLSFEREKQGPVSIKFPKIQEICCKSVSTWVIQAKKKVCKVQACFIVAYCIPSSDYFTICLPLVLIYAEHDDIAQNKKILHQCFLETFHVAREVATKLRSGTVGKIYRHALGYYFIGLFKDMLTRLLFYWPFQSYWFSKFCVYQNKQREVA